MSTWEQHRNILIVSGSFLVLLLLLWLVMLRGYAHEATAKQNQYKKDLEGKRKDLCPEDGPKVALLKVAYGKANEELSKTLGDVGEKLRFRFKEPLIPPKEDRRRQLFVRNQYKMLQEYILKEAETKRQVTVSEQGETLGFNLPMDLVESREQDVTWLQQMAVVRRTLDTLFQVHEEKNEEEGAAMKHLLSIEVIRPGAPVKTGTEEEVFLVEYPVELEVIITLRGLMRLLRLCSEQKTFHIVRSLNILSDPKSRQTTETKRRINPTQGENWFVHHYLVKITLASMTLYEEAEVKEKPVEKPTGPATPYAIKH